MCHRKDNTETANRYPCGLLQAPKRNMERMEKVVDRANYDDAAIHQRFPVGRADGHGLRRL